MTAPAEVVAKMIDRLGELGAGQDTELAIKSYFLENDLRFEHFTEVVQALHVASMFMLNRKTESLSEDDGDGLYTAVQETLLATAQLGYMVGTLMERDRTKGPKQ